MKKENRLILKYEKRLKKAGELKKKIDNPEAGRLLSEHRRLEEEYEKLMDDRTRLYQQAKMVVHNFKLVWRPDKNEIGFIQNYTPVGYPQVCYADEGRFTSSIASGGRFEELTPERFMEKIVKGDFKPIDHICLNCEEIVPYGKKTCENCGNKI